MILATHQALLEQISNRMKQAHVSVNISDEEHHKFVITAIDYENELVVFSLNINCYNYIIREDRCHEVFMDNGNQFLLRFIEGTGYNLYTNMVERCLKKIEQNERLQNKTLNNTCIEIESDDEDFDPIKIKKYSVSELVGFLQIFLKNGNCCQASQIAFHLASLNVKCNITLDVEDVKTVERLIVLQLYFENLKSHIGPFEFEASPSSTIGNLKKEVHKKFDFPSKIQRWIIGREVATDDGNSLASYGVTTSDFPIYVYLLSKNSLDRLERKSHIQKRQHVNNLNEDREIEGASASGFASPKLLKKNSSESNLDVLKSGWSCTECTLINKPYHPGCESCSAARPLEYKIPSRYQPLEEEIKYFTNSQKEMGWKCTNCSMINKPFRPGCQVCCAEKPNDYEIPELYQPDEEELKWCADAELKEIIDESQNIYYDLQILNQEPYITNDSEFSCPVCFNNIEKSEGVTLRNCTHSLCKICLHEMVVKSDTPVVVCPLPECSEEIEEREIKAIISAKEFEEFKKISLNLAELCNPNSVHCQTPNCEYWIELVNNEETAKFICLQCLKENCVGCRVIHENLTCKEYQDNLKLDASHNEDAKKTLEALNKLLESGKAMRCPHCTIILQKTGGCDGITCTMCKTALCWATKGSRWGPRGHGDISGGCRCGVKGRKCHPRCSNCH